MREFTEDWFSGNIPVFSALLNEQKNLPNLKYLEVGSFEGLSTTWLLENILTKEGDTIYCIDTWEGGQEHAQDMNEVERRFKNNLQDHLAKVKICKGNSYDELQQLYEKHRQSFDFIYIDGSHEAWDVISDAILAWPLLKSGGVMGFDDYMWGGSQEKPENRQDDDRRPQIAIDAFLFLYARFLDILHKGGQVWVTKK
jgi:predicted O-methyltransferase YrrM